MECDYCKIFVECEDGSAFCDGTLYSDLVNGACSDCCGKLIYGEDDAENVL